jgi:uncharacterized protein YqjF (DUF2071 family)
MEDLLKQTAHRPWPLPEGPWIQKHTWANILFAHWPVPAAVLRPLVPARLELETWEGKAWVGITPFCITGARLRGVPPVPFLSTFPEVDVRTYVRFEGTPAVFYFSMNAPNPVVAAAARLVYHMPYVEAEVESEVQGERIWLRSYRADAETQRAEWEATYWPTSEPFTAEPGTRESFLIERWALFTVDGEGHVYRTDIHRQPWPVQTAAAEIRKCTLAEADGIPLPEERPLLHYSRGVDVLIWPPNRVR